MQNHRILSIDLIKIIAMICVMGLHSAGIFVYNDNGTIIGNTVYRASVCAIPLFFMVSGYLLLGREKSDYKYSLKKCISIVRFVAICTIGYTLLHWIWQLLRGTNINYRELINNFCGAFIQKGKFSIFWYFGAMIIIYLMYPLLNRLYKSHFKSFVGLLLLLLFFESIVYTQHITHNLLNESVLACAGGI